MKRLQAYRAYLPAISIFSLALCVRLLYNLTVAHAYHSEYDARYYDSIAQNLLREHCFCIVAYDAHGWFRHCGYLPAEERA